MLLGPGQAVRAAEPPTRPARKPQLDAEKANFERRIEACHRLKVIAFETGDRDLEREAEELERRAWLIYLQRTSSPAPLASVDPEQERQAARRLLDRLGPRETEATRKLLGETRSDPRALQKPSAAAPLHPRPADRPLRSISGEVHSITSGGEN